MSYPTDPPIRKLILDNVKTTLEGINGAGSYRSTVQKVAHIGLNALDIQTYPFVAIGPPSFRFDDGQYSKISVELTLTLLLVIRTATNATDTLHDLLEDVGLALRADVTRGGYAVDTHLRGDNQFVPEISEPIYGTEVEVAITYRHLNTDPAAAL